MDKHFKTRAEMLVISSLLLSDSEGEKQRLGEIRMRWLSAYVASLDSILSVQMLEREDLREYCRGSHIQRKCAVRARAKKSTLKCRLRTDGKDVNMRDAFVY